MKEVDNYKNDNPFIRRLLERYSEEETSKIDPEPGNSAALEIWQKVSLIPHKTPALEATDDNVICASIVSAAQLDQRLCQFLENATVKTESPIERIMINSLFVVAHERYDSIMFKINDNLQGITLQPCLEQLIITPQASIGEYRVDILLTHIQTLIHMEEFGHFIPITKQLIVECDGHEYHEKTKEQAQKDKQRDRYLQLQGFSVFRFTGSEIWNDPFPCAESALHFLEHSSHDAFYEQLERNRNQPQ